MFGTEVVTFAHLYNFIVKELKPNGDEVEPTEAGYFGNLDYKKMLKALFKVSSSPLPDEKIWISRQDAARYLSERINVSLDLTKVLEIGMNAQIDFENGENVWFEKVFYFYNKIEVIKNEDFAEPDQLLKFKE
jgi:hypothetical protein